MSGGVGSPSFFVLVSGSKSICLIACPALNTYVHYPMNQSEKLAGLLYLEEEAVPAFSIFVRHGYLQHGESTWKSFHSPRNHSCIILTSDNLIYAVSFTYDGSFVVIKKPATDSGENEQKKMQAKLVESTRKTNQTKKKGKMKAPLQVAQILLRRRIGNKQLLAYHTPMLYLVSYFLWC